MIRFTPRWITPGSTPLGSEPWNEGTEFGFSLSAEDVGQITVPYAETLTIPLGSPASEVYGVSVNGTTLDDVRISRIGRNLELNLTAMGLAGSLDITVLRAIPLVYSLLHGQLPPGVSIGSGGYISGMIGNIPGEETKTYEFTSRVSNGLRVADRLFVIQAVPVVHPTEWVPTGLPTPVFDQDFSTDVYPFGDLKLAESLSARLEASDADETVLPIEVRPTGLSGTFIEGLPKGIGVVGFALLGVIQPDAQPGRYLFRLGFVGQTQNTIVGEIIVENELATNIDRPSVITWLTTDLDPIFESYPCEIYLKAVHDTLLVTYTLAPASPPLPPNLSLNFVTGDIEGQTTFFGAKNVFSFTVRANAGGNYVDRDFSLTILPRFDDEAVLDLRLKLPAAEQEALQRRYVELIPAEAVYRPGDANFGVPQSFIYLIKGLRSGDLAAAMRGDGSPGIDGTDYHGPMNLLFGPHASAVVRDARGDPVYEVIYRIVVDPQARAGGFSFKTDEAVEERVIYSQSKTLKYVFPRSLRNARLDLIRDLGFATPDQNLRNLSGLTGVEALPTWMTSEQTKGDPTSALGFVPALVVAYVRPDASSSVLDTLNSDKVLPPNGHEVTLSRVYQLTINIIDSTSFDGGETVFDGPPWTAQSIRFDGGVVTNNT